VSLGNNYFKHYPQSHYIGRMPTVSDAGMPRRNRGLKQKPGEFGQIRTKTDRGFWRRERDSNPRYGVKPYTRFPGVHLRPLGHLSAFSSTLPARERWNAFFGHLAPAAALNLAALRQVSLRCNLREAEARIVPACTFDRSVISAPCPSAKAREHRAEARTCQSRSPSSRRVPARSAVSRRLPRRRLEF
jgi:hypothetical protein